MLCFVCILDCPTLKGISICFNILKAALCGSYVNFGVFRLYGDDALDKALNMLVKLVLSIPLKSLLVRVIIIGHRSVITVSMEGWVKQFRFDNLSK